MYVITTTSLTCSFKDFLKQTTLPVYASHEKGEKARLLREVYHEDYGFSCRVSDREWTDLDGQFEDAENFIKQHEGEFKRLYETLQIDDIRFDFPYRCRLGIDGVAVQGDYLPASLAGLCGKYNIGIALSHYPACQKDADDPSEDQLV